jgi:hypothetical protein
MAKFQAQIKQSPPVTLLHSIFCPTARSASESDTGDVFRVVHAQNVSDAVLSLIETYMCDGVCRQVTVCNCAKAERKRA